MSFPPLDLLADVLAAGDEGQPDALLSADAVFAGCVGSGVAPGEQPLVDAYQAIASDLRSSAIDESQRAAAVAALRAWSGGAAVDATGLRTQLFPSLHAASVAAQQRLAEAAGVIAPEDGAPMSIDNQLRLEVAEKMGGHL